MNYILSIDVGTTALKTALFDKEGKLLAQSSREYKLLTPTALSVELEVETYWAAFREGVGAVLNLAKVDPEKIRALGISAQGETLILIGKDGRPLRNAIVWLDNRAQEESEILAKEFGDKASYKITGQVKIVPTWPASKIFWIKHNEKGTYSQVNKYLLIEDYFIYRLTGNFVAEGSLLCSTVYWDINTKKWWEGILKFLDVSIEQLPEIKESGEPVGTILPSVAKELGLSPCTVVATGALDQAAGAIGVGNIKPGIISENTGAALAICATVDKPFVDPQGEMPCHYHGIPDTYMAHTFTSGGMVLKWFRDSFCQSEHQIASLTGLDTYDLLSKEAEKAPAGCEGLVMLPHLSGAMAPEANPKAKGVFFGFSLLHSKPYFIRAIMEAIACIVQRNLDTLDRLNIKVNEIRSLGGGSRGRLWNQIKADLTQKPVLTMENEEAACLGAAILAGKAVGMFDSIEEACTKMVSIKERFEPNPANSRVYAKTYENYKKLYEDLCDLFAKG